MASQKPHDKKMLLLDSLFNLNLLFFILAQKLDTFSKFYAYYD